MAALMLLLLWTTHLCISGSIEMPRKRGCEGWWPPESVCLPLGTTLPSSLTQQTIENSGCPQWKIDMAWADKTAFLIKLRSIERIAGQQREMEMPPQELVKCGLDGSTEWLNVLHAKGFAWSRIKIDDGAGSTDFVTNSGECWTGGLADHYIDAHGVVPTKEFQEFVWHFDAAGFKTSMAKVASCQGWIFDEQVQQALPSATDHKEDKFNFTKLGSDAVKEQAAVDADAEAFNCVLAISCILLCCAFAWCFTKVGTILRKELAY